VQVHKALPTAVKQRGLVLHAVRRRHVTANVRVNKSVTTHCDQVNDSSPPVHARGQHTACWLITYSPCMPQGQTSRAC
jgi:hypothetical protein